MEGGAVRRTGTGRTKMELQDDRGQFAVAAAAHAIDGGEQTLLDVADDGVLVDGFAISDFATGLGDERHVTSVAARA